MNNTATTKKMGGGQNNRDLQHFTKQPTIKTNYENSKRIKTQADKRSNSIFTK